MRENPARGIAFGLLFALPFWLAIWWLLSGCIHLTPKQEALLHTPGPPVVATAQELRELLPAFADIPDGEYTLVPRGTMPRAGWMNPFVSDIMMPMHWDCKDFSAWADDKMGPGAAFGKAWNEGTEWKPGHMVTIFIDTSKEVVLYDAMTGSFVRMGVDGIMF